MDQDHPTDHRLDVSSFSAKRPTRFDITLNKAERTDIAAGLDLIDLRKANLKGQIAPDGKKDWTLTARLGATAVQACVVTLAPVSSRVDVDITRRYIADSSRIDTNDEIEMPEDDSQEPLGDTIDLLDVLSEALALALPDYPRHADVEFDAAQAAPPGVDPLTDADTKPFAGLAALKENLEKDE